MKIDATTYERQTAAYQAELSAVVTFVAMLDVYDKLEPELREQADKLIGCVRDSQSLDDERMLSMHTLMEMFFGGPTPTPGAGDAE